MKTRLLLLLLLARPAWAEPADRLLGWVPRASELVFVTNGASAPLQSAFTSNNLPDLDDRAGELAATLKDSPVSLVAVTKFKDSAEFEGCRMVWMAAGNEKTRGCIERRCVPVVGYRIPVWTAVHSYNENYETPKKRTQFFCFPLPDVLLVAYDEPALRETLERIQGDKHEGLPAALEAYRTKVDMTGPFWAIRAEDRQILEETPWYGESSLKRPGSKPCAICQDWDKSGAVRVQMFGFEHAPKAFEQGFGMKFTSVGSAYVSELRPQAMSQLVFTLLLGFRFYI